VLEKLLDRDIDISNIQSIYYNGVAYIVWKIVFFHFLWYNKSKKEYIMNKENLIDVKSLMVPDFSNAVIQLWKSCKK
jgi:hypothetical protein